MSFPDQRYPDAEQYLAAYRDEVMRAWHSVDGAAVGRAAAMIGDAVRRGSLIFSCGNGGSAAISNHLLCDFLKGMTVDSGLAPRVVSLPASVELITAVANDIEFADVFVHPLRTMARPGDLLISISSSGNSENIVRAVAWARGNGVGSIALTGFAGGRSAGIADVNLHVDAANYGVVEDVHQSLMHVLAQYLRQRAMPADTVAERTF
ncbi:MAG TPA: SIS domain-containing protein [Azospirillum sp.]